MPRGFQKVMERPGSQRSEWFSPYFRVSAGFSCFFDFDKVPCCGSGWILGTNISTKENKMDGKSETSGYKCNCFGMSSSGVIKDHDKYIIKQKIACEIPVFNTDYLKQSMCQNKLT